MAAGYGGDIELKVDLDVSPAKKSANSLRSTIDKALGSGDTKVRSMGLQLKKAVDHMNSLNSKMKQMESTKIPTDKYVNLQNELKTLDTQISKVISDMQKMQEAGTHQTYSSEYTKLLEDQKWLLEQLTPLKEKYEESKSLGFTDNQISSHEWYQEYQALSAELKDVEGEIQALIDLGEQYSATPEFQEKQAELDALKAKYVDVEQSVQNLKDTNQDYISQAEADPATYNKIANDANNAATSVGILAQKTETAMSDTKSLEQSWNQFKSAASRAISSVSSTLRSVWTTFKSTASSAISRVSSQLRNTFSTAVSKLSGTHNKSFKSMLTTVLKYGFGIRSIYFLFRKIRTTISTGLSEMSKDFDNVSDDVYTLKNSWSGFKASLVSAFQPIYSYVVPALSTLISYLTTAMNALANFFAMLTGSSTYYKAVKGNESVADSISDTGSSASDANEELAEYDNLVVIDSDSGSGGGGGSGSGSSDAWNWEEVGVETTSWMQKIKDAFNDWDFTELGTELSNKLTSVLQSIPWNTIYSYASNFGKGLATFLNGLITSDLFSALGTTIANAIKTALIAALSFSNNFKWDNLGTAIASGINAFVENSPLSLALENFNSWAKGILTTLSTAVKGISWSTIAQDIADAIANIDASGIGWKLGDLVTALANAIYTLVSNKDTWTNLGTKIGEGINAFFTATQWETLGKDINETFKGIKTALKTALETVDWKAVGQAIADFIAGINWKELVWEFADLMDSVKDAILDLLDGMGIDAGDITLTITGAVITLLAITAVKLGADITKTVIMRMLEAKVLELLGGSAATAGGSAAAVGSSLGTIATVAGEIAVVIAVAIAGWKIGGKLYESATGYSGASQGFVDTVKDLWDGLISDNKIEFNLADFIDFTIDDVNSGTGWLKSTNLWQTLTTVRDSIKSAWNSLTGQESNTKGYNGATSDAVAYITKTGQDSDSVSGYWSDLGKNIATGLAEGIKLSLSTNPFTAPIVAVFDAVVNAIKTKFGIDSPATSMYEYGGYILEGILEGIKQKIKNIGATIQEVYNKVKNAVVEKFQNFSISKIVTGLGNIVINIATTFSGAITKLADYTGLTNTLNDIKTKYTAMKAKLTTTLSGAFNKITGEGSTLSTLATKWSELKNSWTDKLATLKANVGGQMSQVSDITNWQTYFTNLKTAWADKTSTLKAYVGGQATNIEDITGDKASSWKTKFSNFVNNIWKDDTATMKAEATVGGTSDGKLANFVSGGTWHDRFTSFKNLWATTYTTTMKATANVGGSTDDSLSNFSDNTGTKWRKKFTDFIGLWNRTTTAIFNASYSNADTSSQGYQNYVTLKNSWTDAHADFNASYTDANTGSQGYKDFCELWNSWYGRTADFTLSFSSSTANVKDLVNGALGKVYDSLSLAGITMKQKVWFAKGGIVTGLTNLTDIMVGEAGAEAIIPLERNLGWMDKMATSISEKVANIGLPDIATGKILPSTQEFSNVLSANTKNIETLIEQVLIRLEALENNDKGQPILVQIDGRTIAEVVWDESEKRYKQTGVRYAY